MSQTVAEVDPISSVAIVVLAAGRSSRMGSTGFHKLLAEFHGVPLVRRSTQIALGSQSQSVVVVTGYRDIEIRQAIADLEVQVTYNPDYLSGMASSLAIGVTVAEQSRPDGIMIMLADMPALKVADLDALIAIFRRSRGQSVVRAAAQGEAGNPVIVPRVLYTQLKNLVGDAGARRIIDQTVVPVIDIEIGDGARIDVDTPDEIIAAGGALR